MLYQKATQQQCNLHVTFDLPWGLVMLYQKATQQQCNLHVTFDLPWGACHAVPEGYATAMQLACDL